MGAYQNPEQVKDYTMDVANAWAKATSNTVKDLTDYAEDLTAEYKANEKKFKENLLAAQKLKINYAAKVGEAAEGYAGADLRKTFAGKADEYANIQLRLMNNTSTDVKADMEELERLDRMPEQAKKAIATLMSQKETHNTRVATAGQPGGYDIQNININNPDSNTFNGLNSIYGNIPGEQAITLSQDRNGNYNFNFESSGGIGDNAWKSSINSSTIMEMQKRGTSILPYSPDATAELNESLKGSSIYGTVKKMDKGGKEVVETIGATDDMYKFNWVDDPKYVEGKISQNYIGQLDYSKLQSKIASETNFQAKAAGYLANPDQVAALMNSAGFQDPNNPKKYTANDFAMGAIDINSPAAKLFRESLAKYYAHTFPPTRPKVDERGEPIVQIKTADVSTDVKRSMESSIKEKPLALKEKRKILSRGKEWEMTTGKDGKPKAKPNK